MTHLYYVVRGKLKTNKDTPYATNEKSWKRYIWNVYRTSSKYVQNTCNVLKFVLTCCRNMKIWHVLWKIYENISHVYEKITMMFYDIFYETLWMFMTFFFMKNVIFYDLFYETMWKFMTYFMKQCECLWHFFMKHVMFYDICFMIFSWFFENFEILKFWKFWIFWNFLLRKTSFS